MPEIHDSDPSVTGARVGRRPIALGAAWALPTLGATFAAPAFAASPLPCTFPIATPKVTATAPSGGTKGTQNWTVPTGVTAICVEVRGGAGGGSSSARVGGAGALIRAQIAVTPGEILSLTTGAGGIRVTGFGAVAGGTGYGNGGSSPAGGSSGGSGGGGSAIVRGTTPLIVAGGGGGAGSNDVQSGDFTGSANGGYQTASNPDGTTPNFSWSNISTVSIAPGPGKGAVGATAGAGGKGNLNSMFGVDCENVMVESVKQSLKGDGIVVRLYECYGERSHATLTLGGTPRSVKLISLMEDEIASVPFSGNTVEFDVKPYEIVSFMID